MASFYQSWRHSSPTNDSHEPVVPKGCRISQVANFYENRIVLVDPTLYDQLKPVDQVALLIHEFIYLQLRFQGHTDSRYARYYVGKIATNVPIADLYQNLKQSEEYLYCQTPSSHPNWENSSYEFYVYPQCDSQWCQAKFHFIKFAGQHTFETDYLSPSIDFEVLKRHSSYNPLPIGRSGDAGINSKIIRYKLSYDVLSSTFNFSIHDPSKGKYENDTAAVCELVRQ